MIHHFGNHGVDLAGHDGTASLTSGQFDVAKAGLRATGEQSQVVANFAELASNAFENARELDKSTRILRGFHQVGRFFNGDFALFGQIRTGHVGIACGRVDTGANRGRAQVDFFNQCPGLAQTQHILFDHDGIGGEFLPQGHGHCILQLCAADFENVLELQCFGMKAALQRLHRAEQAVDTRPQRDAHGGWIHIIGALRRVHMIVGVKHVVATFFEAELFQRNVGNHLIGVHVGGGACTALNHVHHELVLKVSRNELIASQNDRGSALAI